MTFVIIGVAVPFWLSTVWLAYRFGEEKGWWDWRFKVRREWGYHDPFYGPAEAEPDGWFSEFTDHDAESMARRQSEKYGTPLRMRYVTQWVEEDNVEAQP